jgi:hypothetical protein
MRKRVAASHSPQRSCSFIRESASLPPSAHRLRPVTGGFRRSPVPADNPIFHRPWLARQLLE